MRRLLPLLVSGMFAFSLVAIGASVGAPPASAATLAATTVCANGVDNTGGLGIICEVTIANTITATGGSADITVRECHGAAGDPQASCTTQTATLAEPVTRVEQCNDAGNGGGGTLRCSIKITNTFVADPNPTAVTVNQCVGSGDGITTGCDPFPATTSGATITQCNGSGNGGTLVGLTCTATGTQSDALHVIINQCNGSANGGGFLVICSSNIASEFSAPTAAPTPTATATATATVKPTARPSVRVTTPPTDTLAAQSTVPGSGNGLPPVLAFLFVLTASLVTATRMGAKRG